jgi:hypothetical protein
MAVVQSMQRKKNKVYRMITSNAFWNRVGEDKEDGIRVMALDALALKDTKPTNRLRKIDSGEYVGLDDKGLRKGFNELLEAGFFSQEEFDVIFANATIDEVPEAQR